MAENYDTLMMTCNSAEAITQPSNVSSYVVSLLQPINDVVQYRVKDIQVPATFNNLNGVIFGLQGSATGAQQIAIPNGNWTQSALATYIAQAWLALTGTTITVAFGTPYYRTIVTRTAGPDATIAITATQLALSGMGTTFGFTSAIAAATTLTAQSAHNLRGPAKINICSQALNIGGRNMILKDGMLQRSNVIYGCVLTGNSGAFQTSVIPGDWNVFQQKQMLTKIDLTVCDENEAPLSLNGFNWTITLEFRQSKGV